MRRPLSPCATAQWRHGRFWLALLICFGWLNPAYAQPTINPQKLWQHDYWQAVRGYSFNDIDRLSRTRFVQAGAENTYGVWPPLRYGYLLFINQHGDTLTSARCLSPTGTVTSLDAAIAEPDSGVLTMGIWERPGQVSGGLALTHFDTLGNQTWQRLIPPPTSQGINAYIYDGIATPDGYLLHYSWFEYTTGAQVHQFLVKTDRRGNTLWQQSFPVNDQTTFIRLLPDGTFVVANVSYYSSSPPWNGWSKDTWLGRYTPNGSLLHSTYVGVPMALDAPGDLVVTPDGGYALVGNRTLADTVDGRRAKTHGWFVKLDSLFQKQWEVTVPPEYFGYGSDCIFNHVQPLTNGHYLATGAQTRLPDNSNVQGFLAEIAPPVQTNDTVGQVLGRWYDPAGWYFRGLAAAGDTAYLWGTSRAAARTGGGTYLTKWAGLGQPIAAPLCAQLPGLRLTWNLDGATGLFTAAVDTTLAGPPFAVISRVEWTIGGPAPARYLGGQVRHTFAGPQPRGTPIRVQLWNNLYCTRDTTLYPFGLPTGVAEPAAPRISVFPNPSADGRFTVRWAAPEAAPTTLLVTDAVGRTLVSQAAPGGTEVTLELGAQPAGVYALRLRWPDGRQLTRHLVRW